MKSKGKRLKELMAAPEIVIIPGAYDGYSARLVEAAGFQCASASGAGISESHLGWADKGVNFAEGAMPMGAQSGPATTIMITLRSAEKDAIAKADFGRSPPHVGAAIED